MLRPLWSSTENLLKSLQSTSSALGGLMLASRIEQQHSKHSSRRVACPRRLSIGYIDIWTAPVPVRPAGSNAIAATVKDASSTEDSLRRSSASSSSASPEDGSQGDTLSSSGVTAARRADETVAQGAGGGEDLDTAVFDLFDPNDFFSTTALQ